MITITINIDKAKAIAHDIRRVARAEEFKPLDTLIALRIPSVDVQVVEADRQAIRDRYADMQTQIEAAKSPDEIKLALAL